MNLFWLRYASYVFLAGAAFFYIAIRLNRLYLSRGTKLVLYAGCIAMACVTWYVQQNNTEQHSPRRLVMGTVVKLSTNQKRSGGVVDRFQLRLDGGRTSPEFSADLLPSEATPQPLHPGDYLGVLYRTWDLVPVTIDEIQGQCPGWHHSYIGGRGAPYIVEVCIIGCAGLISAVVSSRNQPGRKPEPDTVIKLSE